MSNFTVYLSAYNSSTSQSFEGVLTSENEFSAKSDAQIFETAEAAVSAAKSAIAEIKEKNYFSFGNRTITVEEFNFETEESTEVFREKF